MVKKWGGVQWLQFTIAPALVGAATFFVWVVILGKPLDPATAFTALALFSIIGFPLGALPMVLNFLIQAQVSVLRLESFLRKPEVAGVESEMEESGMLVSGTPIVEGRELTERPEQGSPGAGRGPSWQVNFYSGGRGGERDLPHAVGAVGGRGSPLLGGGYSGETYPSTSTQQQVPPHLLTQPVVEFEFAQLSWPDGSPLLDNPNAHKFHFGLGDFVCVVGPTACGKTGFLTALLGELARHSGVEKNLIRARATRYCAQSPWICNKTLKDNVIWGSCSKNARNSGDDLLSKSDSDLQLGESVTDNYQSTLACAALLPDLDVLPDGDQTQIGDRGVNLSGGQKARVAIARAIYDVDDADLFVFDDVLSAVDAHVAAHLREMVFFGRLRNKCVVLATHDESAIQRATKIVYLEPASGGNGNGGGRKCLIMWS